MNILYEFYVFFPLSLRIFFNFVNKYFTNIIEFLSNVSKTIFSISSNFKTI